MRATTAAVLLAVICAAAHVSNAAAQDAALPGGVWGVGQLLRQGDDKLLIRGTGFKASDTADSGIAVVWSVTNLATNQVATGSSDLKSIAVSRSGKKRALLQLGSCDVLNLDLQELNLNVLGLTVNLQPVILDIVAVAGGGNLLGNLLCTVAGLLDGLGIVTLVLQALTAVINAIVAGL